MALTQKQQSWATIIENWLSSGLTQAEYCQRNNIKLKELSNWKYRLNKKKQQSHREAGDFLPVTVKESTHTRSNPVTVVVDGVTVEYLIAMIDDANSDIHAEFFHQKRPLAV